MICPKRFWCCAVRFGDWRIVVCMIWEGVLGLHARCGEGEEFLQR